GAVVAAVIVIVALVAGGAARTLEARRANQEAEKARQALAEAVQVSDFLIGLFETVDPDRGADDPESVDELLAKAEATMDEELADQPLARARFLQTIGRIAFNRADLDRAVHLYEQALALREENQAAEHPNIIRILGSLGVIYRRQGREAEAEAVLVRAISLYESSDQPSTGPFAATLSWLANLHYQQGQFEKAADGHRRALELRRREVPRNPGAIGESLNNLSLALRDLARPEEARPLVLEAEAHFTEAFGPDHPLVASSWLNRAGLEEMLGNWDGAEELLMKAAALFSRIHDDPLHHRILTTRRGLGSLWGRWHRFDDAAEHLAELLEEQLAAPAADRLEIARTQMILASAERRRGRLDAAGRLARATFATRSELLGDDHFLTQSARLEMAWVRAGRGEGRRAKLEIEELMAERERTHGADHSGVGHIAFALGRVHFEMGEVDEAGRAFSRALDIFGSVRDGASVEAGDCQLWLGRVRLAQNRFDEASRLLDRSRDNFRRFMPPGHPLLAEAEAEVERTRDLSSEPNT
ncbi:MAG: tetratricopeptide repeat protein, partial [Acidobacteriota bacterium]